MWKALKQVKRGLQVRKEVLPPSRVLVLTEVGQHGQEENTKSAYKSSYFGEKLLDYHW